MTTEPATSPSPVSAPAKKETARTIISLVIMLAWLGFGLWSSARAVQSKSWPTAAGTILSSAEATKSAGKGGFKHGVEYTYGYTVDGDEHHATIFRPIDEATGSPAWKTEFERYRAGSALSVYYNPKDPSDSVIEPGLTGFNAIMTGLPLLFLVVIVTVTVKQRRAGS